MEDPTERKKRAVAKGRNALDVLDALKLGLLDGSVDRSTLARLKVAAEGLTEGSGDPGLDEVLGEIDLRVAVELAKAGIALSLREAQPAWPAPSPRKSLNCHHNSDKTRPLLGYCRGPGARI